MIFDRPFLYAQQVNTGFATLSLPGFAKGLDPEGRQVDTECVNEAFTIMALSGFMQPSIMKGQAGFCLVVTKGCPFMIGSPMRDTLLAAARFLLSLLFVFMGRGKLMAVSGTAAYMASLGVPLPYLATIIAILAELGLGVVGFWSLQEGDPAKGTAFLHTEGNLL